MCDVSLLEKNVLDARRDNGEHFACFKNFAIVVAHFLSAQTRRRGKYGGVDVCWYAC